LIGKLKVGGNIAYINEMYEYCVGGMAEVVEHHPNKQKALGLNRCITK
jgi:hypothetical protein